MTKTIFSTLLNKKEDKTNIEDKILEDYKNLKYEYDDELEVRKILRDRYVEYPEELHRLNIKEKEIKKTLIKEKETEITLNEDKSPIKMILKGTDLFELELRLRGFVNSGNNKFIKKSNSLLRTEDISLIINGLKGLINPRNLMKYKDKDDLADEIYHYVESIIDILKTYPDRVLNSNEFKSIILAITLKSINLMGLITKESFNTEMFKIIGSTYGENVSGGDENEPNKNL